MKILKILDDRAAYEAMHDEDASKTAALTAALCLNFKVGTLEIGMRQGNGWSTTFLAVSDGECLGRHRLNNIVATCLKNS